MVRQLIIAFFFFCFLSTVSAEIYLDSDSLGPYNIGDEIVLSFDIEELLPVVGYVSVNLNCDDSNKVIFTQYVSFSDVSRKNFTVSSLADENGECYFEVSFDDSVERTSDFEVTSLLDVDVYLNSKVLMSGDTVLVNGSAKKYNDDGFNYSVTVFLDDFVQKNAVFSKTNFFVNFSLRDDLPSGDYDLRILIEEKSPFGKRLNSYEFERNLTVLPRPSSLEIVALEEFKPPYNYSIVVNLLDQSGNLIPNESISLKIFNDKNELFYDTLVSSGSEIFVPFYGDTAIGGWRISTFYGSLTGIHPFYVQEHKAVDISLPNGSSKVFITNVGNIPYQGVVEITLYNSSGSYVLPLNVDIPLGDTYERSLAVSGNYNVSSGNKTIQNVFITGNVIGPGSSVSFAILWGVVIFILFLCAFFLFTRMKVHSEPLRHSDDSSVLVSHDSSVKFSRPHKEKNASKKRFEKPSHKPSSSVHKPLHSSPSSVTVSSENPITKLFRKGKKDQDIDISSYNFDDSSFPKSEARDIPLVRKTLSSSKKSSGAYVYGMFFRNDSEDLVVLLKKYGLNVYKAGDMRFSLLKSSKSPEDLLFKLSKVILKETTNKDILIHKIPFSEGAGFSNHFNSIKSVLREGEGILISSAIFSEISDKKSFVHFKNMRSTQSIIKLYRYVP